MVVAAVGCVSIASVFISIRHEALPANGPSVGRSTDGVIRLDCSIAIVCEADKQERAHIGRRRTWCLVIADEHVVTSLKLIVKSGIAVASKLQEPGAMLFLPGGDVGIGCCV